MRTQALITDLLKIHPKGFDLSLGRVQGLLEKLGNPQDRLPPVIHVAGTNGKGSTIAFTKSILEAGGYSVHVHTSPHLVNWQERFRLGSNGGGKLVDDDLLADTIAHIAKINANEPITLFEILSVVMFVLFSEHKADFSIIEVGLGGRFDATNVINNPLVSIITPIALDHQAYLGDTLAKIAFEKAGIIKQECPVAIGLQDEEAAETIIARAQAQNSPMSVWGRDYDCYKERDRMIFNKGEELIDLPLPSLLGDHQIDNAGLAIAALKLAGVDLLPAALEKGVSSTKWAGRMERLDHGKLTAQLPENIISWIDGGHNPAAGKAIAKNISEMCNRTKLPVTLVCAMLTTKEPDGYFEPFRGLVEEVLTLPIVSSEAGFSPQDLCRHAVAAGLSAQPFKNLQEALEYLGADQQAGGRIVLFCGSLYHVGDILEKNGTPPC